MILAITTPGLSAFARGGFFHPTKNAIVCHEHAHRIKRAMQPAFAGDVKSGEFGACPFCEKNKRRRKSNGGA